VTLPADHDAPCCCEAALVGICSSSAWPLLAGEHARNHARLLALPHLPALVCPRCTPAVVANDNGDKP
jgi:hypothetical protein